MERSVALASSSVHQPPAPGGRRQGQRPVEGASLLLQPIDELAGSVELAEHDQSLDLVWHEREGSWLSKSHVLGETNEWPEPTVTCSVVSEGQLQEAERRSRLNLVPPIAHALARLEGLTAVDASLYRLAHCALDRRLHGEDLPQHVGPADIRHDLVGQPRVLVRELPTSGAVFHLRKVCPDFPRQHLTPLVDESIELHMECLSSRVERACPRLLETEAYPRGPELVVVERPLL